MPSLDFFKVALADPKSLLFRVVLFLPKVSILITLQESPAFKFIITGDASIFFLLFFPEFDLVPLLFRFYDECLRLGVRDLQVDFTLFYSEDLLDMIDLSKSKPF